MQQWVVDLVAASRKRLPLAVETSPGNNYIVCEVVRLENSTIVWSDYSRLDDIGHAMYTFHFLEAEPVGDGPEWDVDGLRFFEIGEEDERLMSDWRSCEAAGIRHARERVLTCMREFGDAELELAADREVT